MTRLTPLKPADLAARLKDGRATLIDIREADEFAAGHVPGAINRPLAACQPAAIAAEPGRDLVFTCRSGMRTQHNCDRLADACEGQAFVLQGGLDAWRAAGLPVAR